MQYAILGVGYGFEAQIPGPVLSVPEGVVKILIQDTGSIKNTTCARLNRDMNAPERMAGRGFNFTSPYNFIGHEIEFVEAVSEFLSDLNQNETGTAKQDLDDGLVHLQPQASSCHEISLRSPCFSSALMPAESWRLHH